MLSTLSLVVGLAATSLATPICFDAPDPPFFGLTQLPLTAPAPAPAPASILDSCASLGPGKYTITPKTQDQMVVQAYWNDGPITVGPPSPHMIWNMQPKQGGASDPAGMQLENVALSSIFPDPMFASLGRGFLPTVVTAESDRSIEPTMWTLEEGDDGACMIRDVAKSCTWEVLDTGSPMARIDCTSDESMTDANRPAHQFTFRPVLQNQRLWPAPVPAAPQSCLAAGKYKLLSLTNGFVRVTGPGLPIRTQMTRDFPGWTPLEFYTGEKGGMYIKSVWGGGYLGLKEEDKDELVITGKKPQPWTVSCHDDSIQISVHGADQVWGAMRPGHPFSEFDLQKNHGSPAQMFHALPCGKSDC